MYSKPGVAESQDVKMSSNEEQPELGEAANAVVWKSSALAVPLESLDAVKLGESLSLSSSLSSLELDDVSVSMLSDIHCTLLRSPAS